METCIRRGIEADVAGMRATSVLLTLLLGFSAHVAAQFFQFQQQGGINLEDLMGGGGGGFGGFGGGGGGYEELPQEEEEEEVSARPPLGARAAPRRTRVRSH